MSALTSARRAAYYRAFGADAHLARLATPGSRVLDVGCSDGRGSEVLSRGSVMGADIYLPALVEARRTGRRAPIVQTDARALPYADASFDLVVALDVIEHFEKPDALVLLRELERVARGTVVVVTPSGYLPQPGTIDEPWQEHRCGFEPSELTARGYTVSGLGGPAWLRGDYGVFRGGPLGMIGTLVSQPFSRLRPERAFALLAVKQLVAPRVPAAQVIA